MLVIVRESGLQFPCIRSTTISDLGARNFVMKYTNITERTAFCLQLIIVRERACLPARERACACSQISHLSRLTFPSRLYFSYLGCLAIPIFIFVCVYSPFLYSFMHPDWCPKGACICLGKWLLEYVCYLIFIAQFPVSTLAFAFKQKKKKKSTIIVISFVSFIITGNTLHIVDNCMMYCIYCDV